LYDVRDYRGRLVSADGKPIAGAEVKPLNWRKRASGESQTTEHFMLPAELIRQATGRTGDDGTFVLRGVPGEGGWRPR